MTHRDRQLIRLWGDRRQLRRYLKENIFKRRPGAPVLKLYRQKSWSPWFYYRAQRTGSRAPLTPFVRPISPSGES